MERNLILIDSIPTVVWGKESEKIYIYVHGKNGNKEEALFSPILLKEKVIKLLVLIYHLMVRGKIKILNVEVPHLKVSAKPGVVPHWK